MKTVGAIVGLLWIPAAIFAGIGFLTNIEVLSGIGRFLFVLGLAIGVFCAFITTVFKS